MTLRGPDGNIPHMPAPRKEREFSPEDLIDEARFNLETWDPIRRIYLIRGVRIFPLPDLLRIGSNRPTEKLLPELKELGSRFLVVPSSDRTASQKSSRYNSVVQCLYGIEFNEVLVELSDNRDEITITQKGVPHPFFTQDLVKSAGITFGLVRGEILGTAMPSPLRMVLKI